MIKTLIKTKIANYFLHRRLNKLTNRLSEKLIVQIHGDLTKIGKEAIGQAVANEAEDEAAYIDAYMLEQLNGQMQEYISQLKLPAPADKFRPKAFKRYLRKSNRSYGLLKTIALMFTVVAGALLFLNFCPDNAFVMPLIGTIYTFGLLVLIRRFGQELQRLYFGGCDREHIENRLFGSAFTAYFNEMQVDFLTWLADAKEGSTAIDLKNILEV